jgi:hypothetical protein
VEVLLNLMRPHVLPREPTLSIFQTLPGSASALWLLHISQRFARVA